MAVEHEKYWDNIFKREFEKESDRACVILSVAMLDRALETFLKARLVPISSSEDELLEGAYAPISTFNARIELTHRIGLISTQLRRDLHIIRKIRNDFAHNIEGCTFEDPSVRSRIIELSCSSSMMEALPEVRKTFQKGPRGDFQMTVSWMLWYLWTLARQVSSIKPVLPEECYWSKDRLRKLVFHG
jgi:DNA-binding MltR family transcriptional regulator